METTRCRLTALGATALLATAVSTASAGRLSLSSQTIRAVWSSIELRNEVSTLKCRLTIEGSFHARTIGKAAGSLVGLITRARAIQESCTNGTVAPINGTERYNGTTPPNTLPWHLTYESFQGTLPNISAVRLLLSRLRFGITISGLCIGQYGTAEDNVTLSGNREAGGTVTELVPVEMSNNLTLFRRDGGFFCPASWRITGRSLVTVLGARTNITVALI